MLHIHLFLSEIPLRRSMFNLDQVLLVYTPEWQTLVEKENMTALLLNSVVYIIIYWKLKFTIFSWLNFVVFIKKLIAKYIF